MLSKRFPVNIRYFLIAFIIWLLWMVAWVYVPAGELIWPPLKWIFIVVFAPIGIILLGVLFGYRVVLDGEFLRFGFFPFVRTLLLTDIAKVRKGAVYPLSFWRTDDFVTVVTVKGEEVSFPCDNASEIISAIEPYLLDQ
jgi:hypothetical protein